MANRAHLFLTDELEIGEEEWIPSGAEIIAGANWRVPLLWCSVFEPMEITINSVVVEIDEGVPETISWPVAATPLVTAQQRARDRKNHFLHIFPTELEPVYDEWLEALTRLSTMGRRLLYLDTYDVCQLHEDGVYLPLLTACMRAFSKERPQDWVTALNYAEIPYDPGPPLKTKPVAPPGQGIGFSFAWSRDWSVQPFLPMEMATLLHGYSLTDAIAWSDEA